MLWLKRIRQKAFDEGYQKGIEVGYEAGYRHGSTKLGGDLSFITFQKVKPQNLLDKQLEDILREKDEK